MCEHFHYELFHRRKGKWRTVFMKMEKIVPSFHNLGVNIRCKNALWPVSLKSRQVWGKQGDIGGSLTGRIKSQKKWSRQKQTVLVGHMGCLPEGLQKEPVLEAGWVRWIPMGVTHLGNDKLKFLKLLLNLSQLVAL